MADPDVEARPERPVIARPDVALVVEDEPVFIDLLRDAFGAFACPVPVRVAEDGRAALDALREPGAAYSVVLVDLGLPDLSGIEVVREARALHPAVPVLVASIHSDEAHVIDAVQAGACGYLLKDDTALQISEAIRQVMGGEYPISPSLARHLFRLAQSESARPLAGSVPEAGFVLSPKESELLALLADGCSYKKAAACMGVALSTVQSHIRRIYQKLEAHSKVEAISRARALGLLG